MKIFVKTLTGKVIALEVIGENKVETIKKNIEDKEAIPVDEQRLIFKQMQLQDDKTIAESGIVKDSTLHLVLRLKQLFVKTQSGEDDLILDIEPSDTVGSIKTKIYTEKGISTSEQYLIFNGQLLTDNEISLSDHKIEKDIRLVCHSKEDNNKIGWPCPLCTFVNIPHTLNCDKCNEPRPSGYKPPPDPPLVGKGTISLLLLAVLAAVIAVIVALKWDKVKHFIQ